MDSSLWAQQQAALESHIQEILGRHDQRVRQEFPDTRAGQAHHESDESDDEDDVPCPDYDYEMSLGG